MRNRVRAAWCTIAAATFLAGGLCVIPTASVGQTYNPPRTADGKPDLNGISQALNAANWDLEEHAAQAGQVVALGAVGAVPAGLSVVEGDEIPYLPVALAKKKKIFKTV